MTTESHLLPAVAEILNEVAGTDVSAVTPEATLRGDLDLDSLTLVEVAVAAEERFGLRIDDSAVDDLKTVGDILKLLVDAAVTA